MPHHRRIAHVGPTYPTHAQGNLPRRRIHPQDGFSRLRPLLHPVDIVARWIPTSFGEEITIGEVTIRSGDYALGDRDGVVILPRAMATEVVTRALAVAETENVMRKAILDGMDPQVAYLKYGKF